MRPRSRAFTLVEVLAWLAVAAILISLGSFVVVSVVDAARQARRVVEASEDRMSALERLGPDVRGSARILAGREGLKSDGSCLILEAPDSTVVVYRMEKDVLLRESGAAGAGRTVPLGRPGKLVFRYDAGGPAASRWVEAEMPGRGVRTRPEALPEGKTVQRFYLLTAEDAP